VNCFLPAFGAPILRHPIPHTRFTSTLLKAVVFLAGTDTGREVVQSQPCILLNAPRSKSRLHLLLHVSLLAWPLICLNSLSKTGNNLCLYFHNTPWQSSH